MLIDCDNHLFHRHSKLLCSALHDPDVGLMRNQQVDLRRSHVCRPERFVGNLVEYRHGKLEYRLPVHVQEGAAIDRATMNTARYAENVRMAAVCVQPGYENSRLSGRRQNNCPRTITKQHTRRTIFEIENTGKHFGTDD